MYKRTLVVCAVLATTLAAGAATEGHGSKGSKRKKKPKVTTSSTFATPRNVATQLPPKRSAASMGSSLGMGMGLSESKTRVTSVVPRSEKALRFSGAAQYTYGAVNDLVNGATLKFSELTPQMNVEMKDLGTAYFNIPIMFARLDDQSARTIGRPSLGAYTELMNENGVVLTGGAGAKLGLYDSSMAADKAYSGDAGRSWGFSLGGNADYSVPNSLVHVLGGAEFSYDTRSRAAVMQPNGEIESSMDIDHPIALRTNVAIAREMQKVTVGLGFRFLNELYDGHASGAGMDGKVDPMNLSSGEIFGSYHLQEGTKFNVALVKGFKTTVDPLAFPLPNHTKDMADFTFSVGAAQAF